MGEDCEKTVFLNIFFVAQSLSPGYVKTEIIPEEMKKFMTDMPALEAEDISAGILYVLGTPPRVQVNCFY